MIMIMTMIYNDYDYDRSPSPGASIYTVSMIQPMPGLSYF